MLGLNELSTHEELFKKRKLKLLARKELNQERYDSAPARGIALTGVLVATYGLVEALQKHNPRGAAVRRAVRWTCGELPLTQYFDPPFFRMVAHTVTYQGENSSLLVLIVFS